MRLGITLEDGLGLESNVSSHFGQCPFFLIADIKEKGLGEIKVVKNSVQHGGGGCLAVNEMLKYNITHVIAGGMGMNAQIKFKNAGVTVYGYSGKAADAIKDFINNKIGGLESCKEHGHGENGC